MQINMPTFTIEQLPSSSSLEPGPLDQQAYGDTRAQREREREREKARAGRGNMCVVGKGWTKVYNLDVQVLFLVLRVASLAINIFIGVQP